jgi:chromosome segregation ATPase
MFEVNIYKEIYPMRKALLFVIVVLMFATVSGCIAPPTVEEAQQDVEMAETALCESIKAYAASLAAYDDISAETTVEQVDELNKAVATAHNTMTSAWANLQDEQVQAVESAVAELDAALNDVPAEATLGEVAANIQASANAVKEALAQLDETACVPAN